jgi:uncharacterized membrane protein YfcA
VFGVALAGISAWGFLRNVPLWKVFVWPTLGTIIGGVLGFIVPPAILGAFPAEVPGALVGFVIAIAVLRFRHSVARAPRLAAADDPVTPPS